MERESNQMQALCRSGCGFYGSPATDGLCSLCYKENLKKKQQLPTNTPASFSSLRDTTTAQPTVSHLTVPSQVSEILSDVSHGHLAVSPQVSEILSSDVSHATASTEPTATNTAADDAPGAAQAIAAVNVEVSEAPGSASPLSDSGCSDKDGDKDAKKKKNRCAVCRKKVGLTGFECRCGGLFCAMHRYSDKHNCAFNYREMGAQEIRRNNPVVVGEKIQKI